MLPRDREFIPVIIPNAVAAFGLRSHCVPSRHWLFLLGRPRRKAQKVSFVPKGTTRQFQKGPEWTEKGPEPHWAWETHQEFKNTRGNLPCAQFRDVRLGSNATEPFDADADKCLLL